MSLLDENPLLTTASSRNLGPSVDRVKAREGVFESINGAPIVGALISADGPVTLTNKSLEDDTTFIVSAADPTAALNFAVNNDPGITSIIELEDTTGTTYYIPDVGPSEFVMTEGTQTLNGLYTFTQPPIIPTTGFDDDTIVANAVDATKTFKFALAAQSPNTLVTLGTEATDDRVYVIPDTPLDADFVMTEANQTIGGVKTFTSAPVLPDMSLTLLDTTEFVNAIDATKTLRVNLATQGGNTDVVLQAAAGDSYTYTIPDVASSSFVMTEGAQTVGGAKTFTGTINYSAGGADGDVLTRNAGGDMVWENPQDAVLPAGLSGQVMVHDGTEWEGATSLPDTTTFAAPNGSTIRLDSAGNAGTAAVISSAQTGNVTYSIPATTSAQFIMSTGSQSVGGSKTFTGSTNLSGGGSFRDDCYFYDSGVQTKRLQFDIGGALANTTAYIQTAQSGNHVYAIPDVGNSNFVMSEGAQTINGVITFTQSPVMPAVALTDETEIVNAVDATKTLGFDLSGQTTATEVTLATDASVSMVATIPDVGSADFVMSEGAQTVNGVKTFTSAPVLPNMSISLLDSSTVANSSDPTKMLYIDLDGQDTGTAVGIVTTADANSVYTIPNAGNAEFVMSEGAQTIGGVKTFSLAPVLPDMSLNLQDTSAFVNSVDATKTLYVDLSGQTTATDSSISSAASVSSTYAIPDVGNANFVMSEGAQTINGVITFTQSPVMPAIAMTDDTEIVNAVDATKVLGFDLSGQTTATEVTLATDASVSMVATIPDVGNADFVMTEGTQTVGGVKTFSGTFVDSGVTIGDSNGRMVRVHGDHASGSSISSTALLADLTVPAGTQDGNLSGITSYIGSSATAGTGSIIGYRSIIDGAAGSSKGVIGFMSDFSGGATTNTGTNSLFYAVGQAGFSGTSVSGYALDLNAGAGVRYGARLNVAGNTAAANSNNSYGVAVTLTGGSGTGSATAYGLYSDVSGSSTSAKYSLYATGGHAYIDGISPIVTAIADYTRRAMLINCTMPSSGSNMAGTITSASVPTGAQSGEKASLVAFMTSAATSGSGSLIAAKTYITTEGVTTSKGSVSMQASIHNIDGAGNKTAFLARIGNDVTGSGSNIGFDSSISNTDTTKYGVRLDSVPASTTASNSRNTYGVYSRVTGGVASGTGEVVGVYSDVSSCLIPKRISGAFSGGPVYITNSYTTPITALSGEYCNLCSEMEVNDSDGPSIRNFVNATQSSGTDADYVHGIVNGMVLSGAHTGLDTTGIFNSIQHTTSSSSTAKIMGINTEMGFSHTIENPIIIGNQTVIYFADGVSNNGGSAEIMGNHTQILWDNDIIQGAEDIIAGMSVEFSSNFTLAVGQAHGVFINLSNAVAVDATSSAIYAIASSGTSGINYAGVFFGQVTITGNTHIEGTLSKTSGTFLIDHPQDPENKTLRHSFVEAPEYLNMYRGTTITGDDCKAIVPLPAYFEALNKDFSYQLTLVGAFGQAIVAEEIHDNQFVIETDKPNMKVSWLVMGQRKDKWVEQHPLVVEEEKSTNKKGKYWNPECFGKGRECGMAPPPPPPKSEEEKNAERAERVSRSKRSTSSFNSSKSSRSSFKAPKFGGTSNGPESN